MSAPARGAAFAALLVAIFAVASLAGAEISPSVDPAPEHDEGSELMDGHGEDDGEDAAHGEGAGGAMLPGLASADAGYRMIPERTSFPAGTQFLAFRIVDETGDAVRDFDIEHARPMHLIVVRRDFAGFQHLHPRLLPDGTWEVGAEFGEAGVYRVFADFAVDGRSLTLATDVFVSGEFEPRPLPAPSATADAGSGYEVEISSAAARPGSETPVRFEVSLDGERVRGVEPYLDADGHLVALREHDQAFLHTHPEGEPGGRGPISFAVTYPTPGSYRLYLQFKHGGEVRTAEFTQDVGVRSEPDEITETAAKGHAHEEASHAAG